MGGKGSGNWGHAGRPGKWGGSAPSPWKDDAYAKAGKVSLVPVKWLKKFQGNNLRRDDAQMKEFAEKLKTEGLREPISLTIGQQDRRVSVGEGNHRMFAMEMNGEEFVPVRVVRTQKNLGGKYYDKMSQVPQYDYFPADANPLQVFDTFDDGDYLPEDPDEKAVNKQYDLKYEKMKEEEDDSLGIDFDNLDDFDFDSIDLDDLEDDDFEEGLRKAQRDMPGEYGLPVFNVDFDDEDYENLVQIINIARNKVGDDQRAVKAYVLNVLDPIDLMGDYVFNREKVRNVLQTLKGMK
jgi:ParB-like nuclease domain